jgi:hypothetical protein
MRGLDPELRVAGQKIATVADEAKTVAIDVIEAEVPGRDAGAGRELRRKQ